MTDVSYDVFCQLFVTFNFLLWTFLLL